MAKKNTAQAPLTPPVLHILLALLTGERHGYPHSVDAYVRYLHQRLHQGCHNVSQLWRELRQQGYRGQLSSVWKYSFTSRTIAHAIVVAGAS